MSSPAREDWLRSLGDAATHFDALVGLAADAAGKGDFAQALRFADRTRRLAPDNQDCARLCARLHIRLGQPAVGLRLLADPRLARTAEIEEERARIYLAAADLRAARRSLELLLRDYAVDAVQGLADTADELVRAQRGPEGWIGRRSDGALVGARLDPGRGLNRFTVKLDEAAASALVRRMPKSVIGRGLLLFEAIAPSPPAGEVRGASNSEGGRPFLSRAAGEGGDERAGALAPAMRSPKAWRSPRGTPAPTARAGAAIATRWRGRLEPPARGGPDAHPASETCGPRRRHVDRFAANDRPSVLVLTHGWGGGVERHLASRVAVLEAEGLRILTLTGPPRDAQARVAVLSVRDEQLPGLEFMLSGEADELLELLSRLSIARIEVHHFIGIGEQLERILERLSRPYEVVVHDYGWFCPRIVLVGGEGKYCGEPPLAACEDCVARHGSLIEEPISVADLRARSTRILAAAMKVTAPTRDVAQRLETRFPGLSPVIAPWEPTPRDRPVSPRSPGARVCVGLIGAIGEHKGFERLHECALDTVRRDLPLDFVVIGYSADDPKLFSTGRVFVTGPYEDAEAPGLIERERCDVLFFASIWPETWCYALSHGLASGLPILGFDLGALGERLRGVERARLVSPDLSAEDLNAALLEQATLARQHPSLRSTPGVSLADLSEGGRLARPAPAVKGGRDVRLSNLSRLSLHQHRRSQTLEARAAGLPRSNDAARADDDAWLEVHFGNGETVSARAGEWVEASDHVSWIDAFRVRLCGATWHGAPQYRELPRGAHETPWSRPGDWCGLDAPSRPIFALTIRKEGADRGPRLALGVRFSSGFEVEEAELGGTCASPLVNDPIVGLRVKAC